MATPEMIWLPLERDRGNAVEHRHEDRDADAAEQAEPGVAGDHRDGGGAERRRQHLALEADVEDARALGIEAGEAGKQQRRREPHGCRERGDDDFVAHASALRADGFARHGLGLLLRAQRP